MTAERVAGASRRAAFLAACGLVAICSRSAQGILEVPSDRQVIILTRALSYDRELPARAGKEIVVGVLSRPAHAPSEAMAASMLKSFKLVLNIKVQELSLIAKPLAYPGPAALGAAITAQEIDVLYVCVGLEGELPGIIEVSRNQRILTVGSREEQVVRGLALGVFAVDSKPIIVVNLPAARSQGADFAIELLRVAKVIK